MNKKLIRLTESDLHRIVKESVHKIINEIGDTPKGQDALGQVYGRAIRRAQNIGDKGTVPRKLRNVARDAKDKAYSEADKNNLFAGIGSSFENGINTGYHKAKTNESRINRVVKESVNRILKESETDYQTYPHIRDNGTKVIVMAHFIDYTFSFEDKKLGEFDSIEEAKRFVLEIVNNNEYIRDLADEVYSNMDENDETRIDRIILNIYQDYGDRGLYAIGNGISVTPEY